MRTTLLILAVILGGCDGGTNSRTQTVELDSRPAFVLDSSKPFVIELGRGSGWHGLDIIKVDETGAVQLSRIEGHLNAEAASLQLSKTDVATLVGLVNTNQL